MKQNTPSIENIHEKKIIPLDDVISFTLKNHQGAGASLYYNFGSDASALIGEELLPGESESWSTEENGSFKGITLYVDFGSGTKRAVLHKIVRGSDIKDC